MNEIDKTLELEIAECPHCGRPPSSLACSVGAMQTVSARGSGFMLNEPSGDSCAVSWSTLEFDADASGRVMARCAVGHSWLTRYDFSTELPYGIVVSRDFESGDTLVRVRDLNFELPMDRAVREAAADFTRHAAYCGFNVLSDSFSDLVRNYVGDAGACSVALGELEKRLRVLETADIFEVGFLGFTDRFHVDEAAGEIVFRSYLHSDESWELRFSIAQFQYGPRGGGWFTVLDTSGKTHKLVPYSARSLMSAFKSEKKEST